MIGSETLDLLTPGVRALGWTLLDSLWQGAVIGLVYAMVRLLFVAPRARLLAGHAALLALTIAPLVTLAGYLSAGELHVAGESVGVASVAAVLQVAPEQAGSTMESWLNWVVLGWVVGVVLLCLRLVREWQRLRRLCREAMPMSQAWQQRFERLKTRLGVGLQVSLRESVEVLTPMLIGVLRPTILLPTSLVLRLPIDQVELILVHELAHLRRFDPLFNLLQNGLVTLLFYHPAVHWISRRVREDRELCCDELVLRSGGDRFRYARALLALAEQSAAGVPAPALAASGGVLLQRVERIVEAPAARGIPQQSLILPGLLGLLALVWWLPAREESSPLPAPLAISLPSASSMAFPAWKLVIGDISARLAPAPLSLARPIETMADARRSAERDVLLPESMSPRVESPAIEVAPRVTVPTLGHAAAQLAAQMSANGSIDATLPAVIPDAPQAATLPVPLHRVAPSYPRAAQLDEVEGWVTLDYRLASDGRVIDIAISGAEPAGVFDASARRAMERWRYPAGTGNGGVLSQRFDFKLSETQVRSQTQETGRCVRQTGSRLCRPVNARLPRTILSVN